MTGFNAKARVLQRITSVRSSPLQYQYHASRRRSAFHTATPVPTRPLTNVKENPFQCIHQPRRQYSNSAVLRRIYVENPVMFPLGILSLLLGFGFVAYTTYFVSAQSSEFQAYPEPVAKYLRRALYYSYDRSLNPQKALHNYQQAILVADDMKIDPFGDEMLGIKFKAAALYEKLGLIQKAIDVLEQVRSDCLRWNELFGDKPLNQEKRTRLLAKSVQMSTKLGEYYSHEQIQDQAAAEQKLVWAVTTLLKEQQRRNEAGLNPDDQGGWITTDETGAALEALADHYAAHSLHHLSAPLYLQALALSPPKSCHTLVLMNNLALSLALQHPPPTPNQPGPSVADQLSAAKTWANKVLELGGKITPEEERTRECDEGCAAAMVSLGDFAEMEGDMEGARRWWGEGRSMSRGIGWGEGEGEARRRLERIKGGKRGG